VLPSDPAVSLRAARLGAEDTLARFPEAAELLRVDVQQLARALALVAARAAGGGARPRQPRAAVTAQHLPDRRRRVGDEAGEAHRSKGRAPASCDDSLFNLGRQAPRLVPWRRRAVLERRVGCVNSSAVRICPFAARSYLRTPQAVPPAELSGFGRKRGVVLIRDRRCSGSVRTLNRRG
jgi:hypothetical protein